MIPLNYTHSRSVLHRVCIESKLVLLTTTITLAFIYTNPLYISTILVAVLILIHLSRAPLWRVWSLLKTLAPIMIFVAAFSSLGFELHKFESEWVEHVILETSVFRVSVGGILMGVVIVLRLLILVLSTSLISATTHLEHYIALAKRLRLPYELVLALLIAIRFIPVLMNELDDVVCALQSRGIDLEKGGFLQRLRARIPLVTSMIVLGVRKSDEIGIALQIRGFGASKNVTLLYESKPSATDYIVIASTLSILLIGVYLRINGYGVL